MGHELSKGPGCLWMSTVRWCSEDQSLCHALPFPHGLSRIVRSSPGHAACCTPDVEDLSLIVQATSLRLELVGQVEEVLPARPTLQKRVLWTRGRCHMEMGHIAR